MELSRKLISEVVKLLKCEFLGHNLSISQVFYEHVRRLSNTVVINLGSV